jgi:ceramide glucosyltransferase
VTILKPLCGAEPDLEANLQSFCRESAPSTQILFGARDADDPALAIARRVAANYPGLDVQFVAGVPVLGLNAKVNTLACLAPMARHDILLIADSDAKVGPGDLARAVAPLRDPSVGVASCIVRSEATETLWSRLGALSIDEWFMPSVLVSRAIGSHAYCSGPMVAIRRDVLEAIGGFVPLAPMLADDYELGARARQLGYRNRIADCEVTVTVSERTYGDLLRHELRWMRTIRTVAPVGHACSVLTYALPLTLIAAATAEIAPWSIALVALALALRILVHAVVPHSSLTGVRLQRAPLWMVPLRDLLSFAMWVSSYASRRITWRGRTMWVGTDGVLRPDAPRAGNRPPGRFRRAGLQSPAA